jgi:hypothetical protein
VKLCPKVFDGRGEPPDGLGIDPERPAKIFVL